MEGIKGPSLLCNEAAQGSKESEERTNQESRRSGETEEGWETENEKEKERKV